MNKLFAVIVFSLFVLAGCGGSEKAVDEMPQRSKKAIPCASERRVMTEEEDKTI